MNDMDFVQDLVPDAPLPDADRLAPARSRLLAEASSPARLTPKHRRRRYVLGAGISAAVAAGVAIALVLAPGVGTPAPVSRPGTAAPAALTPQLILARAVTAANARPDITPRPDQFAYIAWGSSVGSVQVWASVDGTHEGRTTTVDPVKHRVATEVTPGCVNGRQRHPHVVGEAPVPGTFPCTPTLGYDPALPTQPTAAIAYLRRQVTGHGTPEAELGLLARQFVRLTTSTYLRPAQLAALFQGFGTLPGMTTVPDAVDGAGRHGVGVSWTLGSGGRAVFVFDRASYDLLGMAVYDGPRQVYGHAFRAVTVVDRVGQTG